MRRLVSSPYFDRKLKKFLMLHSDLRATVFNLIHSLSMDSFSKKYKTHKLSGDLRNCYGVSINKSYRIIYAFDKNNVYF